MQVPDDYPITGLCVVEDPNKCPPGYELILKSHDKRDDCDLWKDSFFKARITRYLCITRIFPLDGGKLNNVLEDIVINNERDPPPSGYSLVEKTIDSCDKATRKKQVCVKMSPRHSTASAINELIVLSRSKRPPPGYTLIGEINGLLLCFKIGAVPPETQSQDPTQTNAAPVSFSATQERTPGYGVYNPYMTWGSPPAYSPFMGTQHQGATTVSNPGVSESQPSSTPSTAGASRITRQDSLLLPNQPLNGVRFKLGSHFVDSGTLNDFNAPDVNFRSLVDIESEYSYPFTLERHVVRAVGNMDT